MAHCLSTSRECHLRCEQRPHNKVRYPGLCDMCPADSYAQKSRRPTLVMVTSCRRRMRELQAARSPATSSLSRIKRRELLNILGCYTRSRSDLPLTAFRRAVGHACLGSLGCRMFEDCSRHLPAYAMRGHARVKSSCLLAACVSGKSANRGLTTSIPTLTSPYSHA